MIFVKSNPQPLCNLALLDRGTLCKRLDLDLRKVHYRYVMDMFEHFGIYVL